MSICYFFYLYYHHYYYFLDDELRILESQKGFQHINRAGVVLGADVCHVFLLGVTGCRSFPLDIIG